MGPQLLRDLTDERVWAAAARTAEAEDACRSRGAAAADVIGAFVPLAAPAERRRLLRARRDAYNGRALTTLAGDMLDVGAVAAYERARSELDRRRAELRTALAELDHATRATIHDRLTEPDFAASVELSVPGLLAEIRRSGRRHRPGSARERRRLLTVFRLLQRAATKPSPFARLAEAALLVAGAGRRPPDRHVRVDRRALDWVQHWVRGPGLRSVAPDQVWVTTNPTVTVDEPAPGRVSWLMTGGPADDLRSAACPDQLAHLLRRLRSPHRLCDLSPDGTVPQQLSALLRSGLLEVGLRPPGHGRQVLDGVLSALPATTDGGTGELRAALRLLRDIEADPSPAPGALTAPARVGLDRLAAACGVSTGGADRLLVTEDLVRVVDEPAPPLDKEVLADLGRVQLIAPLLAPELPFQLAGMLCFRERFGTGSVPLLTAYRWFVESGRAAADTMIAKSTHPLLRRALGLRADLTDRLRTLVARAPQADEVRLDGAELDRVAAALPDELPDWSCAAWPVQLAGDRIVLNGLGCGYGRFAARIAAGLVDAPVGLLREWAGAADVAEPDALAVDVTARFGATANERPRLLPYSLAFPGHALECDPEARIDPGDCTVRVDEERGRLLLHSPALPGRALLPVPQNATLTALAPPLFRWLRRLGPATGSTLAFWDHVDGSLGADAPGLRHYPRLVLGRLVLARRTWKVPQAALPGGADDDAARMVAWHRWCAETGVPRRSFVRAVTLPDPWDVVRGRASSEWVGQARSRSGGAVRKPVYVDLAQPKCWPEGIAAVLTFAEPLPDPAAPDPGTHPTEYVIETSQSPRRRSRV